MVIRHVQGHRFGKNETVYSILTSVAVCHLLNDSMGSLLPSIYPMFKSLLHLSFGQVGL
jgi:FSR family fosmidomycin resistance protein-like MFS transporter